MRLSLKSALIAFLVLWLPLQSAAALAMPFCRHMLGGAPVRTSMDPGADSAYQHHHDSGQASGHDDNGGHAGHHGGNHGLNHGSQGDVGVAQDASPLLCDDCSLCHLACSFALTSAPQQFDPLSTAALQPAALLPYPSHTPLLLQRPPLPV